jgi:hypothetical protein
MAVDVDTIFQDIFQGYGVPVWTEFYREPYVCEIPRPAYDPEGRRPCSKPAGGCGRDGVRLPWLPERQRRRSDADRAVHYAEYGEPRVDPAVDRRKPGTIGIEAQLSIFEGA